MERAKQQQESDSERERERERESASEREHRSIDRASARHVSQCTLSKKALNLQEEKIGKEPRLEREIFLF